MAEICKNCRYYRSHPEGCGRCVRVVYVGERSGCEDYEGFLPEKTWGRVTEPLTEKHGWLWIDGYMRAGDICTHIRIPKYDYNEWAKTENFRNTMEHLGPRGMLVSSCEGEEVLYISNIDTPDEDFPGELKCVSKYAKTGCRTCLWWKCCMNPTRVKQDN